MSTAAAPHRAKPARARDAIFAAVLLSTCAIGQVARAEDPPKAGSTESAREDDMFGAGPAEATTATKAAEKAGIEPGSVQGPGGRSGAPDVAGGDAAHGGRENELFGDPKGGPGLRSDREVSGVLEAANDKLQVGGFMYLRAQYNILEHGDLAQDALRSPNLLDVYLDARPLDRLRAYARARLNFDPTLDSASATSQAAATAEQPAGSSTFGFSQQPLEVLLDQLWMKTDIERAVFITVGRQRIKWGSGRTWNPTDFLNRQKKNPLDIFDVRTGVSLVKVHVPVEKLGWNFYAVGTLDDASSPEKVGGALRAELLFGETEIALTGAVKKDSPRRLGLDVSSALGPFDVHVESAFLKKVTTPFFDGSLVIPAGGGTTGFSVPTIVSRKGDWIPQVAAGAEISIKYSDDDSITLGAEYFFNDAGYSDESVYPLLLGTGQFTPFYLGRHYASLFALLQSPGSWDNTTFILSGVSNLSDGSVVTRLDYQVLLLRHLRLNAFGMWHTGSVGELRFGLDLPSVCGNAGQVACSPSELYPPEVNALLSSVPQDLLKNGLHVSAPLFEVGLGLRMDL